MALFDLTSPTSGRRTGARGREARAPDLEAVLVREQYRALAQLAPYFYGAPIAAAATVVIAARGLWSPLYTVALPGAFLPFAVHRAAYWLKIRARVDSLSLEAIRRDLRRAAAAGPALAFAFSLIAAAVPGTDTLERALLLLGVWIASAASAFSLTRLPHAAGLIVFAASAPLVAALLRGGGPAFWLAALLLVISCLVIFMLGENYRAFADIVRSRCLAAEKHRAAEEAKEAATAIANTDYLTSLPNRRWMQSLLASRVEAGQPFAVGLLDLDGFKPINDIHGHPAGDTILRQAAERLAAAMRGRGHAARMGGDEFAVVCEGVGDSADQADELIRLADVALYRAKANGREKAARSRAELEQALHRAVANDEIAVFFQPIVDLATGRVSGFESLARWTDARLGAIEPSIFIPAAERIGLIDQLSRDLLRKAAAAARWPGDVALSFNLSAAQLANPSAGSDIVAALEEIGLPPTRFEVELTEAAIMKDPQAACATA